MQEKKVTDWNAYYDRVDLNPARETVKKAIKMLKHGKKSAERMMAIDLGCGSGRDTLELLNNGFHVLAIDAEKKGISRLLNKTPDELIQNLETLISDFENIKIKNLVHLINASYSLPFCNPEHFYTVWNILYDSLLPGGYFSDQLFGNHDEWSKYSNIVTLSKSEIESLFADFDLVEFKEEEGSKPTALGNMKYWHIFHIVAKKKVSS